jgi:AraC-like DNA-binding protein
MNSPANEACLELHCLMSEPPPQPFSTAQIGPAINRRGRHRIAGGDDGLMLLVNRDQPLVIQRRGREITLEPGEACLLYSSEPLTHVNPFFGRTSCIRIPDELPTHLAPRRDDLIVHTISRQTPALTVLVDYLDTIDRRSGQLLPPLRDLVETHIHDLVALVLGSSGEPPPAVKDRGLKAARERAINQDIASNMGQRDLDLAAVAARHHVSPRSLQRMFERNGTTFTEHLLSLRLNGVYRLLRDSRHAARSISELAFDCGFGDMSHFNHAFRRTFNASPTDIRRADKSR